MNTIPVDSVRAAVRAVSSEEWYRKHAEKILALKKLGREHLVACKNALKDSREKIYRGVALDVDGTIIDTSTKKVDSEIAKLIGDLLRRGVPVILISGRGRTSLRDAANAIRLQAKLPLWYLRRLQCVAHNGTHLLYTNTSSPERFLEQEEQLCRFSFETEKLKIALLKICTRRRPFDPFLTREPASFRVVVEKEEGVPIIRRDLSRLEKRMRNSGKPIFLTQSTFEGKAVFDISPISKVQALRRVALRMGLHLNDFVRIGDRGDASGNDYALLNSQYGYSVEKFSAKPTGCFPVLDFELKVVLTGATATRTLVSDLWILPPLSLASRRIKKRLHDLRAFERLAQRRGNEVAKDYAQMVGHRYRVLETTGQRLRREYPWSFSDAFDCHSGAVKIRDWDLPDMLAPTLAPAYRLFGLGKLHQIGNGASDWSMFTDTGIIFRGPIYYWSLARKTKRTVAHYPEYAGIYSNFFRRARQLIPSICGALMTPLVFKTILAIYDNLRNFAAQSFYVAYVLDASGQMERRLLGETHSLLENSVSGFANALINPDKTWSSVCEEIEHVLLQTSAVALRLSKFIKTKTIPKSILASEVFKFRETDFFLQNYAAVEIALRDLARHGLIGDKPTTLVGLAFGGLDLPALGQYVCHRLKIPAIPSVIKISMYSDHGQRRDKIYNSDPTYVRGIAKKVKIPIFGEHGLTTDIKGANCVVMDDNCTTCATLQLARDVLFFRDAKPIAAIVVRYPGINRFNHMALQHHGFPEPENLFSFVRGLVSPSPYSRLVKHNSKFKYEDQLGIFDKNKARIEAYLIKRRPYPRTGPLRRG